MELARRQIIYSLSILGVIAFIIKLIPILRFGPFAFGHDYGFYRRYLIEPFASFPNTPVPGLDHTVFIPRIALDITRRMVGQPDVALYGTYIISVLISVVCVSYLAQQYVSKRVALYAVSLYVLSGIQFLVYDHFFFKQIVALPFFLLTIVFLEKKWYLRAATFGVFVILTHQTTSIILICIITLGFVLKIMKERAISITYIFSGTAIFTVYLLLHPHVAQKIATPPVGIFVTQTEYLLWSAPLLVLSILGISRLFSLKKQKFLLIAGLLAPLIFVVFHLPFYNRVYPFLDIFLIIPAALGIETIIDFISIRTRKLLMPVICLVFLIYALPISYLLTAQTPLVNTEIQEALPALTELPQKSVIITSPSLLPWVQGWSLIPVYAPGNLKEPHSINDWSRYWSHQDVAFEKEFLSSFPHPLYMFAGPMDMRYLPQCVTKMSPHLFSVETCE